MTYCVDVITADASQLRNRGLAYAFTSSPYMITAFAGPKAAESFQAHSNWRWGFGMFAIILPAVAAPLFFVLRSNLRKAKEQGVMVEGPKVDRTLLQAIKHYLVEFDSKYSPPVSVTFCLIWVCSIRRRHLFRRSHCLSSPVQHCCPGSSWLVNRLHYCHDCRWFRVSVPVWRL